MTGNLAQALWRARVSGTVIPVADEDRPKSDVEAYVLQAEVTRASGVKEIGWKLGATAAPALELLGVKEPFFGPLLERQFYDSGAEVRLIPAHKPGIESEFTVGLGADLPPRGDAYTRERVADAVAWLAPAFEIVGCRFEGGVAGSGNMAIADSGVNMTFVQGAPFADWRSLDLSEHSVTLYINGEEAARGHSGMLSFGDPIAAVAWLANHPAMSERGLKAGEIITTGTCTGLLPIKPGDRARADFGALGEVTANFTE